MTLYRILIHLIEARSLRPKSNDGIDPIFTVEIKDQKLSTPVIKKSLSCTFDENFCVDVELSEEEFKTQPITFSCFDANTFTRNVLIGRFALGLPFVYEKPHHEVFRQWLALTDPAVPGVQGYFKATVVVLKPGESPFVHDVSKEEEDETADGKGLSSMVILPPELHQELHELVVRVYKAEGLPKTDTIGSIDPYLFVHYNGTKQDTRVVRDNQSPVFRDELRIPFYMPCMNDAVVLELFDRDVGSQDDLVAATKLSLSDALAPGAAERIRWVNLYGERSGTSVRDTLGKRKGRVMDTEYKGRVMLSMFVERASGSSMKPRRVESIPLVGEPPSQQYTFRMDLYQGTEFPSSSVQIEAKIGNAVSKSKSAKEKSRMYDWMEQLKEFKVDVPDDLSQAPDLIINAYAGDSRVGFIRASVAELIAGGGVRAPRWRQLEADPTAAGYEVNKPMGFVLFSTHMCKASEMPADRAALEPMRTAPFEIRAAIYQARNLLAADDNGTSDPYVKVRIAQNRVKTSVKMETLSPAWYEHLKISANLPEDLSKAPDVSIQVWDYDQLSGDDLLGRVEVPPSEIAAGLWSKPRWAPLNVDGKVRGEVLIALQVMPQGEADSKPLEPIQPPTKKCVLEASLIGLRKLKPVKLFPVGSPFVVMECGEDKRDPAKPKKNVITTKTFSGRDANILEPFRLVVDLPEDPLFAPYVDVKVYDKRGAINELVGTCSIPTADLLPWTSHSSHSSETAAAASSSLGAAVPPGAAPGAPGFSDPEEDFQKQVEEESAKVLAESRKDREADEGIVPQPAPLGTAAQPLGSEEGEAAEKPRRPRVDGELESTFKHRAFESYELLRGVEGDSSSRSVGRLQARFKVFPLEQEATNPLPNLKAMFAPKQYEARVYVLRGRYLVPIDASDKPDPYLKVDYAGKSAATTRDRHLNDTYSPDFNEVVKADVTLPGDAMLDLSVVDWNAVTADQTIGRTRIDLEQRLFNEDWSRMEKKPLEYRTIWIPTSNAPQGVLEMWVELVPKDAVAATPIEDISPPKALTCELRAIVWGTEGVLSHSEKERLDLRVVGTAEWSPEDIQSTDVHRRAFGGQSEFNWRMKFPVVLPCKIPRVRFQVWHVPESPAPGQAAPSPQQLSEVTLDLNRVFKRAFRSRQTLAIAGRKEGKSQQAFTIDCYEGELVSVTHPSFEGSQGSLKLSMDLVTLEDTRKHPASFGRTSSKNANPTLPEPIRPNPPTKQNTTMKWNKEGSDPVRLGTTLSGTITPRDKSGQQVPAYLDEISVSASVGTLAPAEMNASRTEMNLRWMTPETIDQGSVCKLAAELVGHGEVQGSPLNLSLIGTPTPSSDLTSSKPLPLRQFIGATTFRITPRDFASRPTTALPTDFAISSQHGKITELSAKNNGAEFLFGYSAPPAAATVDQDVLEDVVRVTVGGQDIQGSPFVLRFVGGPGQSSILTGPADASVRASPESKLSFTLEPRKWPEDTPCTAAPTDFKAYASLGTITTLNPPSTAEGGLWTFDYVPPSASLNAIKDVVRVFVLGHEGDVEVKGSPVTITLLGRPSKRSQVSGPEKTQLRHNQPVRCKVAFKDAQDHPTSAMLSDVKFSNLKGKVMPPPEPAALSGQEVVFYYIAPSSGEDDQIVATLASTGEALQGSPIKFSLIGTPSERSSATAAKTRLNIGEKININVFPVNASAQSVKALPQDFVVDCDQGSVTALIPADKGRSLTCVYSAPNKTAAPKIRITLRETGEHVQGSPLQLDVSEPMPEVPEITTKDFLTTLQQKASGTAEETGAGTSTEKTGEKISLLGGPKKSLCPCFGGSKTDE